MILTYVTTAEEQAAWSMYISYRAVLRGHLRRQSQLLVSLIAGLAPAVTLLVVVLVDPLVGAVTALLTVPVAVSIWRDRIEGTVRSTGRRATKLHQEVTPITGATTLLLTDNGMDERIGGFRMQADWSLLRGVIETEGYVFLDLGMHAIVIPCGAFASAAHRDETLGLVARASSAPRISDDFAVPAGGESAGRGWVLVGMAFGLLLYSALWFTR